MYVNFLYILLFFCTELYNGTPRPKAVGDAIKHAK